MPVILVVYNLSSLPFIRNPRASRGEIVWSCLPKLSRDEVVYMKADWISPDALSGKRLAVMYSVALEIQLASSSQIDLFLKF